MKTGAAFTLLELIIITVIVSILTVITIPTFRVWRENSLDKEAIATLKVLRAAQRGYRMDLAVYLGSSNHATINAALKVQLPLNAARRNWNYVLDAATGCCQANRNSAPVRNFRIRMTEEESVSGTCP